MSESMENVLRRVAAGELTPEQALELLDESAAPPAAAAGGATAPASTGASAPSYGTPSLLSPPGGQPSDPARQPSIRGIKVQSSYRSLEIVADPQVSEAHVTGEHSIRLEEGVMVVTTPGPLDDTSETPLFSFSALPRTLNWIRTFRDRRVQIRVNPAIAVELDVTGVELQLTGLRGGLTGRINASAVKLDQVAGRLDLQTFSSSVKGNVTVGADSQLTSESSSVRLSLAPGSDVRIDATSRMGKLSLPDGAAFVHDGETTQFVAGAGTHRLSVDCVMSSVTIDVTGWARAKRSA